MGALDYLKNAAEKVKNIEGMDLLLHDETKKTLERTVSFDAAGKKITVPYSCPDYLEWYVFAPKDYGRGGFNFEKFQNFLYKIKNELSSEFQLKPQGNRTVLRKGFEVPQYEYYNNKTAYVHPRILGNPHLTFDVPALGEVQIKELPLDISLPNEVEVNNFFAKGNIIILPDSSLLSILEKEKLPEVSWIFFSDLPESPVRNRLTKGYNSMK